MFCSQKLVDFVNGWTVISASVSAHVASSTWEAASSWHTTAWHTTWHTTTAGCVDLLHDRIADAFEFFLFSLKLVLLCELVSVKPFDDFLDFVFNSSLVSFLEFVFDFLVIKGVTHAVSIVFKTVLSLDFLLHDLVFISKLLSFLHHTVDVVLGKATLFVRDGDLVLFSGGLVLSTDVEDTVCVDVEGDFDLWDATRCWWDSV